MSDELKQELNSTLSQLIRDYEKRGLSPEEIGDSMHWHGELAHSREEDRERVLAD